MATPSSSRLGCGVAWLVFVLTACGPQPPREQMPATWCGAGEGALLGGLAPVVAGMGMGPGGAAFVLLAPVGAVIGAVDGANNQPCPVPAYATADPAALAGLSRQDVIVRFGVPNVVWDERAVIVYRGQDDTLGILLIQFDATGQVLRAQRLSPVPMAARAHFDEMIRNWAEGEPDAKR